MWGNFMRLTLSFIIFVLIGCSNLYAKEIVIGFETKDCTEANIQIAKEVITGSGIMISNKTDVDSRYKISLSCSMTDNTYFSASLIDLRKEETVSTKNAYFYGLWYVIVAVSEDLLSRLGYNIYLFPLPEDHQTEYNNSFRDYPDFLNFLKDVKGHECSPYDYGKYRGDGEGMRFYTKELAQEVFEKVAKYSNLPKLKMYTATEK